MLQPLFWWGWAEDRGAQSMGSEAQKGSVIYRGSTRGKANLEPTPHSTADSSSFGNFLPPVQCVTYFWKMKGLSHCLPGFANLDFTANSAAARL